MQITVLQSAKRARLSELTLRLVPTAVAIGCSLVLAWKEYGSFVAAVWLPYAVIVTLVLAVFFLAGAAARPTPAAAIGVAALLALGAWTALSLTWSAVPALARDEALLAVFYAVALTAAAVTVLGRRERVAATALVVGALSLLTLATAVELIIAERPEELYTAGRLYFPIDYVNAQAALFLIGFWPAISFASRRSVHSFIRALALGGAAAMLCGWVLTQSKGGGLALAVSAIVVFSVSAARLRLLIPTLIAAAGAGAAVRPLTGPFRADQGTAFDAAVSHAGVMTLVVAGATAVVGLAYALIDRRVEPSARGRRVARVLALAFLIAGVAIGVGSFLVVVERPGHFFSEKWRAFKVRPETEQTASHFLTLGSNRYDFWRVAVGEFERRPIAGVGARGFATEYLRKGQSNETPQRAHSLELDQLAETGLVGFALLATGILVPLLAVARRARASLLASGLLGAGTYWLTHATVDWIWTFPAATLPAFVLLGIGVARNDVMGAFRGALPAAAAAGILALVVLAPPWVSNRLTVHAPASPNTATEQLRWARRLDPLSTEPLFAQARLAGSPGDIRYLQKAVEKEPRRPEVHYRLGLAYLVAGRREAARHELREALRLNPRDELIAKALEEAG